MRLHVLDLVVLAAASGAALMAGAFFAFSSFVMGALGKLPPAQGIAAMQSINLVVINPWFMSTFIGTAALSLATSVTALVRWQEPGAAYLLGGSVLYFAGTFLVTMRFNVPRNNALAAVVPTTTDAARLWADYLVTWTAWNTVRTVAALAAMVAFVLAFRLQGTR